MSDKPQIETCVDDSGSTCMIYAKGKFDPETFAAAVKEWEEWDHDLDGELYPVDLKRVYHRYMRWVPVPPQLRDDLPYTRNLVECKPGRGAFEVTYFELG